MKSKDKSTGVKRYSGSKKIDLLEKYRELRKEGASAKEAAKAVGVSYLTLRQWEKNHQGLKRCTFQVVDAETLKKMEDQPCTSPTKVMIEVTWNNQVFKGSFDDFLEYVFFLELMEQELDKEIPNVVTEVVWKGNRYTGTLNDFEKYVQFLGGIIGD
jgi:hypothetical protein